ncbi:4-alpha-glucanotransferase [Phaeacidiphilus oryzae]|uniref:4-alpha-glucanotransferase n=1 Tax=Phaeacidiphilus oryzae TaxID=348818 RepID=UPI00055C2E5C|nr:4-alpha-glucanotransferase [Phaeacidiphilus oryzae]
MAEPDVAEPDLRRLAAAYGIDTEYDPGSGPVPVSAETLVDILAAFGVDASSAAAREAALAALREQAEGRLLPPCLVVRSGHSVPLGLPLDTEAWVELEDGRSRPVSFNRLPTDLPVGRHTLCARARTQAAAAPLIVAPARLDVPRERAWGFLVQLYSVLSQRSWGIGDLVDLNQLAWWSGQLLGAGFVQVNPLHSALPGEPSPYRPSSRRYPDPIHLRPELLPEAAYLTPDQRSRLTELEGRAAGLREAVLNPPEGEEGKPPEAGLIDRDAVSALKHQALALVHAVPRQPGREAAYQAFLEREGEALTDHATWCALAEVHGPAWRGWPEELRDPRNPAVERARSGDSGEVAARVEYHRWLQWCLDEQLAEAQQAARGAGMPIGIVHDLAVGAHPEGADAWALQRVIAPGISVGAPPDAFNPHGQDWGLPPWRPDALAAAGYRPWSELLRGVLRRAGGLRVDHVMGLFRLWWIPEGRPPTEGAYVRYDPEAMLGVLALEAERAGSVVIGEDLGTVEPGVREALADRGVIGTSVLWFERDHGTGEPLPAERWRDLCLATLTTHDLPSTAARLTGSYVELRDRLGLLARPLEEEQADADEDREEWLGELAREGLLAVPPYGDGPAADDGDFAGPAAEGRDEAVRALHRFLLRTPARLLGVWLPDVVGDPRPQNLPGTSNEYPNWRLPVADPDGRPVSLEEITAAPGAAALGEVMRGDSEEEG